MYVYDIANNALNHYEKPRNDLHGACYTTNYVEKIYIIGGGGSDIITNTYIFDGTSHHWSNGPNLNVGRSSAACIFNKVNGIIYVFGGFYTNSIEIYDTLNSNEYILLKRVSLTWSASNINAFIPSNSNTIFIVGDTNGACNRFTINTQTIDLCPSIGIAAWYHCGAVVENDHEQFQQYYGFGFGEDQKLPIIKYAKIYFVNVNLSDSSLTVFNGQRVPINITVYECGEHITFTISLVCNELNIDYTLKYDIDESCTLYDNNNNNMHDNCSYGILPKYYSPLIHPQTIKCNNVAIDNDVNVSKVNITNNFNITYFEQYFMFNISSTITPIIIVQVNEVYISDYNESYYSNVIFDSNAFNINASLNISLNNESTVKQCNICYTGNCNQCNDGITPIINPQFNQDSITTFIQIIPLSDNFFNFQNTKQIIMNQFINFTTSSTTISPGESIPIIINNALFFKDGLYEFNVVTHQKAFTVDQQIRIDVTNHSISDCNIYNNDYQIPCLDGIFPSIDTRFINTTHSTFIMHFESFINITIFPLNGIAIKIVLCHRGYGIDATSSCTKCVECGYNQFMLIPSVKSCHSCIQQNKQYLDGVSCLGSDIIIIAYNYWAAALSKNNKSRLQLQPLIDFTNDSVIYSVYCPSGFCCGSSNGCNYINAYDEYYNNSYPAQLCAYGRNPSSILCGQCEHGKSVLFGSANCGICNETNYVLIILIIFLIYLPFSVYIIYFESVPRVQQKAKNQNRISQQIRLLNCLFFDVIFYFYQTVSVILNAKGFSVSTWSVSLFAIINLQPNNMNSNQQQSGFCIIANMDSFGKLLFSLAYPSLFIVILIFIAFITKITPFPSLKYWLCCCCMIGRCNCNNNHNKIIKYFDREPYFKKAMYRILLLYVGSVLSTLFQLSTFLQLPNGKYIHYNAPNKYVNASTIIMSLLSILFIICLFLYLWYSLFKQTPHKRYLPQNELRSFLKSFKQKYWFWQFIILTRRWCIALYAAFQFLESDELNILLSIVLLIFILLNHGMTPYRDDIANAMETLCLSCLLIILNGLNYINEQDSNSFKIFISFFMYLPLLSFVCSIVNVLYVGCNIKKLEIDEDCRYVCKCICNICCCCRTKKHGKKSMINVNYQIIN
eukprot:321647_1